MSRYEAVPVGTRRQRSNGLWQVKVAEGRWEWEPREKPRRRHGRVVAFEVGEADWAYLSWRADDAGFRSVAALARHLTLGPSS